ncbi:MAG: sugar phosphate isomerase/epimerase family protein [Chthoniobacterales bacterium]
MRTLAFKTLWGHSGSVGEAALQAKQAGFEGLEGPVPQDSTELSAALQNHGLEFIAEISTTGFATPAAGTSVREHLDAFERGLDRAAALAPRFVTTMAGSDLWPFRDSVQFLTAAWEIAQALGIRVGFETHRSRSLFHPIRTMELLAGLPPIELTLDFSHWCVVTERLVLDELPNVLALCAERALHFHARIGYDQGPQVPDPRAPEFEPAVSAHLRWWRTVWESQRHRGFDAITFTPEFGPDGYLHCEPFSQRPVADLWDLNVAAAELVRREFQQWKSQPSALHAHARA